MKRLHYTGINLTTYSLLIFLMIFLTSGISCKYPDYFRPPQDDGYEENDSQIQAFDLSAYENQYLSTINNKAVHLDADWYKFTIAGTQTIQISCLFTFDYANDLDLELYSITNLLASSTANTSDEVLVADSLPPGTYYIYVYNGLDGDQGRGTSYDLKWENL